MPEAPEEAKQGRCRESEKLFAHFRKGEAHPADFLEESGGNPEQHADPESIGSVDGRHEGFQKQKKAENEGSSKFISATVEMRLSAAAGLPVRSVGQGHFREVEGGLDGGFAGFAEELDVFLVG